MGQTLANSFQSEVNTSKPALLLAVVICSSVFEEGSESLLQFLELLRGTAFECLQFILGGISLFVEGSDDFLEFYDFILILGQILIDIFQIHVDCFQLKFNTSKFVLLLAMVICSFVLDESSEVLLKFFASLLISDHREQTEQDDCY